MERKLGDCSVQFSTEVKNKPEMKKLNGKNDSRRLLSSIQLRRKNKTDRIKNRIEKTIDARGSFSSIQLRRKNKTERKKAKWKNRSLWLFQFHSAASSKCIWVEVGTRLYLIDRER